MVENLKVATWNVCLGLKNKKDYVARMIRENDIDVCGIQECEIDKDFPPSVLAFKDYNIEIEENIEKARVCMYIKQNINYKRRKDLEGENLHLVVIDIESSKNYRIVNIYRSFQNNNELTQRERFCEQIIKIKTAVESSNNTSVIIMGDFNLDENQKNEDNYRNHHLYEILNESFDTLNLLQLINFPTWSRLINNSLKSSILDHVYARDPTEVTNITNFKPIIGDHLCVMFNLKITKLKPSTLLRRDWRHYSKELLEFELAKIDWQFDIDSVQEYWNVLENLIIGVVDTIVPIVEFINNSAKNSPLPTHIKTKINTRKRLLKQLKNSPTDRLNNRIKNLNAELRAHFYSKRKQKIRRGIKPGNSKTLWDAVKISKDSNINPIPKEMELLGEKIKYDELPDAFARFFKDKVDVIANECKVEEDVYNGRKLCTAVDKNFMLYEDVLESINAIKPKNSEGYDRIPQRILLDGVKYLTYPLTVLFNKIYLTKELPEQWLVAKIIPIFKKGTKQKIENYRPIANLCCTTKVFENLILKRIMQIQAENDVDITRCNQHGFKRKKSTLTAGLELQSIIARAVDDNQYALMCSLDLSAAFDLVNVELLLKRLRIIGLPNDVVQLIKSWLSLRYYYVTVDGNNSYIYMSDIGIIQGSGLGPLLYAVYVSPIFDIVNMTNFADDNYVIECTADLTALIENMQKKLEAITKWLKKSGLKVNDSKTEMCLFSRSDCHEINLIINGVTIISKQTINVLGVIFDAKLQWTQHVAKAIKKSKQALHAINMIKKYFTQTELLTLLTSNFYSILYYNSEIWHLPTLKSTTKQKLLSASSQALKKCTIHLDSMISNVRIHEIHNRALPTQICAYKHAIMLFKLTTTQEPLREWIYFTVQQINTSRQLHMIVVNNSRYKIGGNIMANRFQLINGKIPFEWLSLSIETYKVKCKDLFLKHAQTL